MYKQARGSEKYSYQVTFEAIVLQRGCKNMISSLENNFQWPISFPGIINFFFEETNIQFMEKFNIRRIQELT